MERRPYLHDCSELFPVLLPFLSAQAVKDLVGCLCRGPDTFAVLGEQRQGQHWAGAVRRAAEGTAEDRSRVYLLAFGKCDLARVVTSDRCHSRSVRG